MHIRPMHFNGLLYLHLFLLYVSSSSWLFFVVVVFFFSWLLFFLQFIFEETVHLSWRVFHTLSFADCIFLVDVQYFLLRILFLNAENKIYRIIVETHYICLGIKLLKHIMMLIYVLLFFKKKTR